jgi:hypothetical protein
MSQPARPRFESRTCQKHWLPPTHRPFSGNQPWKYGLNCQRIGDYLGLYNQGLRWFQGLSHFTTDSQSVSQSVLLGAEPPTGTHDQILAVIRTVAVLSLGVLPVETTGRSPCLCEAIYIGAVCEVRGLTLLLRVGTLWRCGDGLFFEVPPLASNEILTTLHPLLENVLQTVCCKLQEDRRAGGFELGAAFSRLGNPRNRTGWDLNWWQMF